MKKSKHILALATTIYLVWGLLSSVFVQAQVGTTVSISAPTQVAAGSDFIAMVNVESVSALNAANYDVTFNPAALQVVNATSGLISETIIPVDMWGVITPGKLRVILNLPSISGASGSGYLSQIQFHVIGSAGSASQINLANGMLSDHSANQIPANWVGATIDVYAQTPISTPTPTPLTTGEPTFTPAPTPTVTSPGGGGAGGDGGQMPSPTLGLTPTPPAMPTTTATPEVTPTTTCGPLPTVTTAPAPVHMSASTATPLDLSGVIDEYGVTQNQLAITFTDIGGEIDICQGATALTVDGDPLRVINLGLVSMPPAPPADSYIIGLAYDFGPTGAAFNPPMTLILQYDPALCPDGIIQEDLVIAYYDAQAGKWVELKSTVNTTSHTITTQVSHFDLFAILGKTAPPPSAPGMNESLVGGIIAAVIVIGAGVYFLVRRKRGLGQVRQN